MNDISETIRQIELNRQREIDQLADEVEEAKKKACLTTLEGRVAWFRVRGIKIEPSQPSPHPLWPYWQARVFENADALGIVSQFNCLVFNYAKTREQALADGCKYALEVMKYRKTGEYANRNIS